MSAQTLICDIAASASLQTLDICTGGPADRSAILYAPDSQTEADANSSKRYLIASLTKPVVAMAGLKLATDGAFSLSDRIGKLLPDFARAAYRRITVRHLLTHTSGFPDMLPDNTKLRAAHASLDVFLQKATDAELEFQTAADCRYSSVGLLILGAIIENAVGQSLPEFLRHELFEPLQMNDSWLGLPAEQADDLLPTVQPSLLPNWQPDAGDWGWNSRYWRTLGAPWGGMISTAEDLGRFASMMLSDGCSAEGNQVLPPQVVRAAMQNQTETIFAQPSYAGTRRPWGYGWRRQWPEHQASFGDFISAESVGHWGATGTMMWIDPVAQRFAVILTTTPYEDSRTVIQRISNVLATS